MLTLTIQGERVELPDAMLNEIIFAMNDRIEARAEICPREELLDGLRAIRAACQRVKQLETISASPAMAKGGAAC